MEIFRKKGFKIFFAFFAAFFMGVFGFGVVNFFGGGGRGLVTVGKKEIKPQDYLRAYENISARNRQSGQTPTLQQQNTQKVQALHSLISSNIIETMAEEMGLAVTDEELIQTIENYLSLSFSKLLLNILSICIEHTFCVLLLCFLLLKEQDRS